MAEPRNVYWDANVLLSYVNGEEAHLPVLESLLSDSDVTIYTSVISIVEVAFGEVERNRRRPVPRIEERIDSLWADPNAITLVEFHDGIGREATRLIRASLPQGGGLRPYDAIHLATAQWLSDTGIKIAELHTYDRRMMRQSASVEFPICEPNTAQLNLFSP